MLVPATTIETVGRSGTQTARASGISRGRAAPPTLAAPRTTTRLVLLTFGGLLISLFAFVG